MLNLETAGKTVLTGLFEGYISNHGTSTFDITQACKDMGYDAGELGNHLKQNGWIKNLSRFGKEAYAEISWEGIKYIRPDWYSEKLNKIVSTLGINGNDWTGILEILGMSRMDYQIAHDIGNALQRSQYAEWQPQHEDVYIKLTLRGLDIFNSNKAGFIKS